MREEIRKKASSIIGGTIACGGIPPNNFIDRPLLSDSDCTELAKTCPMSFSMIRDMFPRLAQPWEFQGFVPRYNT